MRKFINLFLILVITSVLILPANTQAANPPWRWSNTYRSDLQQFLTNWKGASNPSGCWRSLSQMDPPGCLSLGKVGDILVQLDNDGYFKLKNPLDRRNYLMNTTHQVYVMKKVVMYFEQVLNPNTIVYWADQTAAQNQTESALWFKFAYQRLKDGFIEGDSDAVKWDGSEQAIWALAFVPVNYVDTFTDGNITYSGNFPVYNLRPKKDLNQSALDQVFNTTRMQPYAFLKNQIDPATESGWSPDEENALWAVMRAQTEVLNFARINKISPTLARDKLYAMKLGQNAVLGNMSWGGGIGMVKGVTPAELTTTYLDREAFTVGSRTVPTDWKYLKDLYQSDAFCHAAEKPAVAGAAFRGIQAALSTIMKKYRNIFGLEDDLVEIISPSHLRIACEPQTAMPWEWADPARKKIVIKGTGVTTSVSGWGFEEYAQLVREFTMVKRYRVLTNYFGGGEGGAFLARDAMGKYSDLEMAFADWVTAQELEGILYGYSTWRVPLFEKVVRYVAKRDGITVLQARQKLIQLHNSGKLETIGAEISSNRTGSINAAFHNYNPKIYPWENTSDLVKKLVANTNQLSAFDKAAMTGRWP